MHNAIVETASLFRPLWHWFSSIAGIVIVIWAIFKLIPGIVEECEKFKAKVYAPLSRALHHSGLARAAIKADIQGNVNGAINQLASQMPTGWISNIDIKWVNNETRTQFFEKKRMIVHMRPVDDQERNFVTVVNVFLKEVLFGNVRELVPNLQRTAAELMIGDRIACMRGTTTANAFGQYIFEPATQNTKVEKYFHRYNGIDDRGLFSGPFIREVKHVAEEVRATRRKSQMAAEMNDALVHLEHFSESLDKHAIPPDAWLREGIMTKYGLLLVANPLKAAADASDGYLTRVEDYYKRGVARLYVLGTAKEREFALRVIKKVDHASPYQLEQRFDLFHDYRREPGGIGAVFSLRAPIVASPDASEGDDGGQS